MFPGVMYFPVPTSTELNRRNCIVTPQLKIPMKSSFVGVRKLDHKEAGQPATCYATCTVDRSATIALQEFCACSAGTFSHRLKIQVVSSQVSRTLRSRSPPRPKASDARNLQSHYVCSVVLRSSDRFLCASCRRRGEVAAEKEGRHPAVCFGLSTSASVLRLRHGLNNNDRRGSERRKTNKGTALGPGWAEACASVSHQGGGRAVGSGILRASDPRQKLQRAKRSVHFDLRFDFALPVTDTPRGLLTSRVALQQMPYTACMHTWGRGG